MSDEDFAHFHLHCPSFSRHSTVFGISCNRQIAADKLQVKAKDVTRSTVQKAVVVLARQPIFAPLREKLGIVTRAFFAQPDLADTSILIDFHETLEAGLRAAGLKAEEISAGVEGVGDEEDDDWLPNSGDNHDNDSGAGVEAAADPDSTTTPSTTAAADPTTVREGVMYMGTSLRELIFRFRFKTLILVKLLLLQRRIMFFGYPVERLCVYEYTLVSLIPSLFLHLDDCATPELDYSSRHKPTVAEGVRTSDRRSLLRFCGCPLRLFGQDAFFQPYLPLQQIELLRARSWLVGTTNLIFKQQREFKPDVVVDLEQCTLDYTSDVGEERQQPSRGPQAAVSLASIVSLTAADRKWMDELVSVVAESYNPADPARPTTMRFEGSEDWIRAKFEDYICSLLSCVKWSETAPQPAPRPSRPSTPGTYPPSTAATDPAADGLAAVEAFGSSFIGAFKKTHAYSLWTESTSPLLPDLVPYRHPCVGRVSALEDVGLRLSAGIYDLRLEERGREGREYVEKAGRGLFSMAERFGSDIAKRRRDWLAQQQAAAAAAEGTGQTNHGTTSRDEHGNVTAVDGIGGVPVTTTSNPGAMELPASFAPHAAAAQQAAMQASTEVRAAFGRFGNYLGSRGWGSAAAANPASPSPSGAPTTPKPTNSSTMNNGDTPPAHHSGA